MTRQGTVWAGVIGQDEAVRLLTATVAEPAHAYLFVGPTGSTKEVAARAFAALLLDPSGDPSGRVAQLALSRQHPDVIEIERTGPSIDAKQADFVVERAALAPTESRRKVLILHEFHLLSADAAAKLLKAVEEPPPSTFFLVLADQLTPELVTIASRCLRIPFLPLTEDQVRTTLATEGISPEQADVAAALSGGDIDRARLLATDAHLAARRAFFADVPHRLDGTGATVATLVTQALGMIEEAMAPLAERHTRELAELAEREKLTRERGSGRPELEARQRREVRRFRTDELRFGLTVMATTYRNLLIEHTATRRPDAFIQAVERIHQAIAHLERNANETLLLQSLLLDLPSF